MKQKENTYPFRNNKEINAYNAKCFSDYRKSFCDEYVKVPLDSIRLYDSIHINAKSSIEKDVQYYISKDKKVTTPMIVRKAEDGYVLLAGWKYFQLAHALSQDTVRVFVTDSEDRISLMKAIGCYAPLKVCRITELLVPSKFDCTVVNPEKLESIKTYDYKYHAQMKPIVVNKDMLIVDGYAQYVYNRNMGKEYCEVRFAM